MSFKSVVTVFLVVLAINLVTSQNPLVDVLDQVQVIARLKEPTVDAVNSAKSNFDEGSENLLKAVGNLSPNFRARVVELLRTLQGVVNPIAELLIENIDSPSTVKSLENILKGVTDEIRKIVSRTMNDLQNAQNIYDVFNTKFLEMIWNFPDLSLVFQSLEGAVENIGISIKNTIQQTNPTQTVLDVMFANIPATN